MDRFKFKRGDVVRCVREDISGGLIYPVGKTVVVDYTSEMIFVSEEGAFLWNTHWELCNADTPENITVNGVEYIRKPEPPHVWKFGDWARVSGNLSYEGLVVFIAGSIGSDGYVPFCHPNVGGEWNCGGLRPENLTYISSSEIPK